MHADEKRKFLSSKGIKIFVVIISGLLLLIFFYIWMRASYQNLVLRPSLKKLLAYGIEVMALSNAFILAGIYILFVQLKAIRKELSNAQNKS